MNITICIGRPTIDKAASGEPVEVGHGVTILAADDLFHASPYAEIERLRDAVLSAKAWLDTWAQHVGTCPDGQVCTCGLDAIRNEVALSILPIT